MPVIKTSRSGSKVESSKKLATRKRAVVSFPKTKTIGRWIYVYDDEGHVVRQIARPFGKTSVPLAQIRKAVRKVISERLQREADEEK